uniref:Ig-like domain-containing protein n=1 Tax=Sinocyclocheilus anshuiensis TaxID=1608454 RepID=A0A671PEZ5_9TELE
MKCALKGSTINLSGTYKHPNHLTVTQTFWTVNPSKDKSINLLAHPDYRGRVQFFQNQDGMIFLSLSNVTHEDEAMYCLRILTNEKDERFLGFPGPELKVTELRVEIPAEIIEGESPVLFCKTTCDLSGKTEFTWYKNGKCLSVSIGSNQLLLQSVSSDDTGNYSCAVRDQKHLPSPAVSLSVRYSPQNVSVSISPSGEIEGDSVTLSCSSDSNPPADFTWFKGGQYAGSGRIYSISRISSDHSGEYKCRSRNKHGVRYSDVVILNTADSSDDTYTALDPVSRTSADIYSTIRVSKCLKHFLHSRSADPYKHRLFCSSVSHSLVTPELLMTPTWLSSFSPDLLNMRL